MRCSERIVNLLNCSKGHIMAGGGDIFAVEGNEPMRWPLRYQILIPFAALTVVAIVAVSSLAALTAAQRAQRHIEEQLRGIAATLVDSTFPLTDVVLRQMAGLSGADFVLAGTDGRVLAASRALRLPASERPAAAERWQQLRLGPPIEIEGERFFQMVLSLDGRGAAGAGRLTILYPERTWSDARHEAALPPLAIGGAALAATALVAFVIASRLARPILELRKQVNRIARADFSPMTLPQRNDELRDLATAVNHLAEQLSQMDRAIRRSERLALLGQLVGGLIHHLRNSVTGALMAVQLHARRCDVDRESLEVAIRQLALTEENLKQFLAAPQPDAGLPQRRGPCRLQDVVKDVLELIGPSLRHRRVALEVVDGTAATHRQDSPTELVADASQLRQLLVNLVLNAADAAGPAGRVTIEVDSTGLGPDDAGAPAACLILRVRDNGPGPREDIADRLFEPFITSKPEGVGLGLAVARQIAQSHGGQIVFSHRDGETCFEVHLPLTEGALKAK